MKMPVFYFAICLLFSLSLGAQNNSLSGKVLFLSSDKTPVVGVEISGSIRIDSTTTLTANSVYTADDGSYRLVFPKAAPGHVVTLNVGDKDVRGEALEIVNEEELRICRIPEDPAEEFEIIVCKKGERDIAAKHYYGILKTSAERELDKMKKEWSALVAQSEKDYEKINKMSKRIDDLQKQTDSLQLYKDALRIASINKDNATKRILRYLKLLDEGTSIQEARKELSINKAINELEVGILKFNAAVTELQTRAEASKSVFDYKDAIRCYDTLISYSENMGVDRLRMIGHYTEMAEVFLDDGNYEKTLKYFQKVIDIVEKVLDSKNRDLATSYSNIGIAYLVLGQYEKALQYHQKALAIRKEVLDSKHRYLATTYDNIGNVYKNLGQYKIALEFHREAIGIQEEVLESTHPDLATSYNNIGNTYQISGQYKNALKYHLKALAIEEKISDFKNPKLAASYNNLGSTYHLLGQYELALEYYQKALSFQEGLNPDHPNLAAFYNNIASTYGELDQYATTLKYQQKSIVIVEKVLSPEHPNLAIAYNNIASTYDDLNQHELALEYFQKSISIKEKNFDSQHPDLGISYHNIASIYSDIGQYKAALEYHKKAITVQEKSLDAKHPDLAATYNSIGNTYKILGEYDKALKYSQKSINILESVLGPKHANLAPSYNIIAGIYKTIGKYEASLKYYQKSANIREENLGLNHPSLAISYNNISTIYRDLGQYGKALEYLPKYVNILEKNSESKNADLALVYNNTGSIYEALGQYKEALEYHQKSLEAQEGILNNKNPSLEGISYMNIAIIHAKMKDFQKAIMFMEKCLAVFEKDLSENHSYYKEALDVMAAMYYDSKNYQKVIETDRKAAKIFPEIKKESFYSGLGLAYTKNDQFKEAQKAFAKYEKLFPDKDTTYRNWAMYYALQNDNEKALQNLKKAVELGYNDLEWLKTDDSMDSLREEKAFMELIKKLEKETKR